MFRTWRPWSLAWALLVGAGCFSVSVDGVQYACGADEQCGAGYVCDLEEGVCVPPCAVTGICASDADDGHVDLDADVGEGPDAGSSHDTVDPGPDADHADVAVDVGDDAAVDVGGDLGIEDGDASDPCRADGCWEPDCERWVHPAGSDSDEGTSDEPWATLQKGVDASPPGCVLHVAAGLYSGSVVIDVPGLRLQGAGASNVFLEATGTGVLVTADGVVVEGLTVSGARLGVHFQGALDAPLTGGSVLDCVLSQLAASGDGTMAAGIAVEHAGGVTISDNEVLGVLAEAAPAGVDGGLAAGVYLREAPGAAVADNVIDGVQGGGAVDTPCGKGAGVFVLDSPGADGVAVTIEGNEIRAVDGGLDSDPQGVPGGASAVGAGIYLAGTAGARIGGNALWDIDGGSSQQGFGLYLEPDALDAEVRHDASEGALNTLDGEPIFYLHGVTGPVVIEGHTLTGAGNPSNRGVIAVHQSSNVHILDNTLASFHGEIGCPAADCPAIGVHLDGCTSCLVSGNDISQLYGGGGNVDGSEGIGVLVAGDSSSVEVTGNAVRDVDGGDHPYTPFNPPEDGRGVAVDVSGCGACTVSHLVADDIETACLRIAQAPLLTVRNLTCRSIGPTGHVSYGVQLLEGAPTPVEVLDSIITGVEGKCLHNHHENPAQSLTTRHSLLHGCSIYAVQNVAPDASYSEEDPAIDPDSPELHLLPGSPAIDAGDPDSDFCLEPEPDGCRANLGAWGNTEAATSAAPTEAVPEVPHCGCGR